MVTREQKVDMAFRLRREGLTYEQVAARTGLSRTTVYRMLNPRHDEQARQYRRDYRRQNLDAVRAYDRSYSQRRRTRSV